MSEADDLVASYLDEYEFRGEADYTPNEDEYALLMDALHGFIYLLGERGLLVAPVAANSFLAAKQAYGDCVSWGGGHDEALASAIGTYVAHGPLPQPPSSQEKSNG